MAHEYATLALLKRSLTGITDTARDDVLQLCLEAASRQIDNTCDRNRRFYLDATASTRTFDLTRRLRRDDEGDRVLLDDIGAADGLVIEYGSVADGWSDISSLVETLPENALATEWPITAVRYVENRLPTSTSTRLRVTARWGWPNLPPEVTRATLIQAARLFKRQDSPEGVLGGSDWGAVRVGRVDPDVQALVQNYVHVIGFA